MERANGEREFKQMGGQWTVGDSRRELDEFAKGLAIHGFAASLNGKSSHGALPRTSERPLPCNKVR